MLRRMIFDRAGRLVEHTLDGVAQSLAIVQSKPKEWPWWAQWLASKATPDDKGIGDVLYRTIGPENSEAFKVFYKSVTGKNCGCAGRQAKWNRLYPLNE